MYIMKWCNIDIKKTDVSSFLKYLKNNNKYYARSYAVVSLVAQKLGHFRLYLDEPK